jgi:hypothetical protein
MSLVSKPEELIEPPAERMIGCRSPEVPLPNDAIDVACHGEGVGKGLLGERKSEARFFVLGSGGIEFMAEPGPVFSSQKPGPGRAAIGSRNVSLGETSSSLRDPIDVRSRNFLVSLTSKFSVAQVVSQKDDQVGHPFVFFRMQNGEERNQGDQKRVDFIHEKEMSWRCWILRMESKHGEKIQFNWEPKKAGLTISIKDKTYVYPIV